jgi:hypothetical protein
MTPYEEKPLRQQSWYSDESPRRQNPRTESRRRRPEGDRKIPNRPHAQQVEDKLTARKREKVRKTIEVDALGIPVETMKDQLSRDISAFVKEMNSCVGYDKQKQTTKDRLQDRIYAEYEVHGESDRVDERYIKKCGTKALITWRHTLNKAVDNGEIKPPELNIKYWEELKKIRETEDSKKKSVLMGNQARNRGLRNSTKERIRQAATVKLVRYLTTLLYFIEIIVFVGVLNVVVCEDV